MSQVVDFFQPHGTSFYQCLALEGATGIARYLTASPLDVRQITPQEVMDAHAAGLAIHFFYEMSPTYPAYFTFAQGAEDCRQAVARLQELRAPPSVVYFAVDTNIDPSACDLYFNGVESMATLQIIPGIYGFQWMCEHARANYPNLGKHLAQTYGTQTGPLDLWQHEQVDLCGVVVDLNECMVEGWKEEMDQDQFNRWFDARLAESPEYVNTVLAIKGTLTLLAGGETELRTLIHDTEYEAVVTALLDIKPEALKPAP